MGRWKCVQSWKWPNDSSLERTTIMRYMCLIYEDEAAFQNLSDADRNAVYSEYRSLGEALEKEGRFVTGSELTPTRTAATVRVRNGKTEATDGPFAETREQLGG